MRKMWIIVVLIAAILVVGGLGIVTSANSSHGGKITKPLGFGRNAFEIPNGSTVVHVKGITEIYDSSGRLWLKIEDRDVGNVSTPCGIQKATRVYQVPSGSLVKQTSNGTVVYYHGKVILRVLNST